MSLHPKTPTPKAEVLHKASGEQANVTEPTKRSGCRRLLWRLVIRGFILLVLVGGLGVIGFYASQPRYYNILIIGSDQRTNEQARSDVLMVMAIPKSSKDKLSLITIPRDTKIEDADYGLQKITHFYAMWDDSTDRLGNRELTTSVVENLLDIQVEGTVEVTFDSFDDIIDILGGVDLESGHLDAAAAEEAVHNRFVQQDGDFGRADVQREILKSLMPKLKSPANMKLVYEYLNTSERARLTISQPSLVAFGVAYALGHKGNVTPGEINEVVLPGEGTRIYTPSFGKSLYYWELDTAGTADIVTQYLK